MQRRLPPVSQSPRQQQIRQIRAGKKQQAKRRSQKKP
jgi:hypothetical protein